MEGCAYPSYLLDTQYRMHPEIVAYPNQAFYHGRLKNSAYVLNRAGIAGLGLPARTCEDCISGELARGGRAAGGGGGGGGGSGGRVSAASAAWGSRQALPLPLPLPAWLQHPYAFIDTTGYGQGENGGGHGRSSISKGSIANKDEADLIAEVVRVLHTAYGVDITAQVCIITFYAAQVTCIQQSLSALGLSWAKIRVLTVDSFQGSESDIILLSFVRSNTRNSVGFVRDMQRLNVAITRAKHLMLCIGDAKTLLGISSSSSSSSSFSSSIYSSAPPSAMQGVDSVALLPPAATNASASFKKMKTLQNAPTPTQTHTHTLTAPHEAMQMLQEAALKSLVLDAMRRDVLFPAATLAL